MVINTGTVLALSCPQCGKLNFHAISLFAFSSKKSLCFDCDCEKSSVTISTAKYKKFVLKTGCTMCEADHTYYLKYKELFSPEILSLVCLETGLEIGFIGSKDQVMAKANQQEKSLSDLVEGGNLEDFFDNPEIMLQVLEYVHRISEKGLLACKCGNSNIDLDILPDRLEMVCNDCGNKGVVFAESREDFLTLQGFGKIELSDQGIIIRSIEPPSRTNGQSKK
ncbi:MAG: hypothetical protein ACOX47_09225 [Bacillota bacterium]|jgi:hypothetical protein